MVKLGYYSSETNKMFAYKIVPLKVAKQEIKYFKRHGLILKIE